MLVTHGTRGSERTIQFVSSCYGPVKSCAKLATEALDAFQASKRPIKSCAELAMDPLDTFELATH